MFKTRPSLIAWRSPSRPSSRRCCWICPPRTPPRPTTSPGRSPQPTRRAPTTAALFSRISTPGPPRGLPRGAQSQLHRGHLRALSVADGCYPDNGRFNIPSSDRESVDAGRWIDHPDAVTVAPTPWRSCPSPPSPRAPSRTTLRRASPRPSRRPTPAAPRPGWRAGRVPGDDACDGRCRPPLSPSRRSTRVTACRGNRSARARLAPPSPSRTPATPASSSAERRVSPRIRWTPRRGRSPSCSCWSCSVSSSMVALFWRHRRYTAALNLAREEGRLAAPPPPTRVAPQFSLPGSNPAPRVVG